MRRAMASWCRVDASWRLALAGCADPRGVDGDLTDDWPAMAEAGGVHPGRRGLPGRRLHRRWSPSPRTTPVDCAAATPGGDRARRGVHRPTRAPTRRPAGGSAELRAAFAECDKQATGYVGDDWRAGRLRLAVARAAERRPGRAAPAGSAAT